MRTAELTLLNKTLSEISIRDSLTNAYNRLYFERYMEEKISNFNPDKDTLHLCMFDLDLFKKINDTFGHGAGDEQLKFVVQTINTIIDNNTILARVGGEEFILVFSSHETTSVLNTLESIRKTFEDDARHNPCRTTASFGLVRYEKGMSQKQLLKKADVCLYNAKETGRNKIVMADTPFNPLDC